MKTKIRPLQERIDEAVETITRDALIEALEQSGNNVSAAAAMLGISRFTAYRMLRRVGLEFSRELTEK
jgi:transcriptional regulator of acetoin/glycerol metabolism